ncbi:MAG TPA: hypothetical protein VKR43_13510 [Bryobacteraceae bacterium]|nr:hypothetical protein [Bryobacteraceae bacterium]
MKLRFHGNSLRLRLSQSEVSQLADFGCVEDRVEFAPAKTLKYRLESGAGSSVTADFTGDCIRVTLPRAAASHWIESDDTGIEGSVSSLKIFVEKDFQCLHRDSPEDADSFPNPLAKD